MHLGSPMSLKVEPRSPQTSMGSNMRQQPSSEKEETLTHTSSIKRLHWSTQTLRGAQKYVDVPKSTFRESEPLKKFQNYMAFNEQHHIFTSF